uniref:Immunoglobulin domain-containing protein n=1 Tax=Esox lucius TaxID=8010 RepID=A0A3P8YCA3_ESOLU
SWMSVYLCVVTLSCFTGLCVEASPYGVLKVEGGYVTFSCFFGWSENNNKFICKKTCSDEDILVETKGSRNVTQGRYSITDNGNGVFSVTIKDLKKSDSGEYWCGVERSVKDSYKELYLSVRDGKFTVNLNWLYCLLFITSCHHNTPKPLNNIHHLYNSTKPLSNILGYTYNASDIYKHPRSLFIRRRCDDSLLLEILH